MKTLSKLTTAAMAAAFLMLNLTSCTKDATQTPSAKTPSLDDAKSLAALELCHKGHKPPPPKCGCVIDSANYGLVTTFAGNGNPLDIYASGTAAGFSTPLGLVPDMAGNLYFTQGYKVDKITTPGATVSIFAGGPNPGTANGYRTSAGFGVIYYIAIGPDGSIYVSQPQQRNIRKISPTGIVTTFAGSGVDGFTDGPAATASFHDVGFITVDSHSNVYVTESFGSYIRKITPAGIVSTFKLTSSTGTDITTAHQINGLAVDAADNIYATDGPARTALLKISPAGVVNDLIGYIGTGFGALTVDPEGNIYIGNGHVISKVSSTGVYTVVFAGNSSNIGATDGVGTAASFEDIESLAVGKDGFLYVGDHNLIRKVVIKVTACKTAPKATPPITAGGSGVTK